MRPLLAVLLLAVHALARADVDLAACPDLVPSNPPPVLEPRDAHCAAAVARAARAYVNRTLRAQQHCFDTRPAWTDATSWCLGRLPLTNAPRLLPDEAQTADAMRAARAAAIRAIERTCASGTFPGACATTAPELASCVLADQDDHVLHLLGEQYGDGGDARPAATTCRRALSAASRRLVGQVLAAQAACLARHTGGEPGVHRAKRCLGSVEGGVFVPPEDVPTASRIAEAVRVSDERIGARCTGGAAAAVDACGGPAGPAACVACSHRREAILLAQGVWGGAADRPTTHFVDWGALANPIVGFDDRMLKNQSLAWADGWFWLFTGQRFEPDFTGPRRQWILRSRDLVTWEQLTEDVLGRYFGDLQRIDGLWHLTTNGNGPSGELEVMHATSTDLLGWTPFASITPGLVAGPVIDGSLARAGDRWIVAFQDRTLQLPFVARSAGPDLDGAWVGPQRAFAGGDDPVFGFAEALHLLAIDGVQRMVATGRDPDRYRCAEPAFALYACDHEPWIYAIPRATTDLADWTRWVHARRLRVPFEAWNTVMHANTGHVADWRAHDGFFYLSYSGATDGFAFELRGHGRLGIARSRDLVHWRVAGDLRD